MSDIVLMNRVTRGWNAAYMSDIVIMNRVTSAGYGDGTRVA